MRVIAEGAPRREVVFTAVRSKAARQSFRKWPLLANVVPGTMLLQAQTGGEADIQGSVTDVSGASIPYALITATNNATGVSTTRETSGAGLYTISPMVPGTYTVTATAPGFQGFEQENFSIDALKLTGLNISLSVGSENQQVTVTGAPPALETTNAALGGVIENQTYENLPLQMSGQQRDPTAFAALLPGVQGGARAPVIGGTGNYLAAVYVDRIPVTTINQQGDNRIVSNAIPVEAIDQFQVVTSTWGAEYQGAGLPSNSQQPERCSRLHRLRYLYGGFREPRRPACGTSQLLTHTRPQIGQTPPAEGQRTHATFAP